MQTLHDTLSRPSRPEGPGPRPRPGRRVAGGAAVPLALLGPVLSGVPARATASNVPASSAATSSDRLLPGETLPPGGQALWSAGPAGHSGAMLVLQPAGNAVIQAPASSAPTASAPASSIPLWSTDTYRQTYADIQLAAHGWSQGQARQSGCLDHIWQHESKWNELAGSPGSAYGIPQASPGAKMAAAGPDWLTSPQTQIRWGEDYIEDQYGTPCQAWAYWQVHKNY